MHRDHDHGDHHHDHFHPYDLPGGGRNRNDMAQWQTPHLPDGHAGPDRPERQEPDFDLVEKAFCDSFATAPDPTSFLRLAGIPFEGLAPDGTRLKLLRVEETIRVDIGALSPHLGGETFRYDPLPAQMASKRKGLTFSYFDGADVRPLSFAEAKALTAGTG